MAKVITSTIPEFPGTITLCEPLTLAQCYVISIAFETININKNNKDGKRSDKAYAKNKDILDALIACSERWDITGQPEKPTQETFVASPVEKSNALLSWAFSKLSEIYFGEQLVPNG